MTVKPLNIHVQLDIFSFRSVLCFNNSFTFVFNILFTQPHKQIKTFLIISFAIVSILQTKLAAAPFAIMTPVFEGVGNRKNGLKPSRAQYNGSLKNQENSIGYVFIKI